MTRANPTIAVRCECIQIIPPLIWARNIICIFGGPQNVSTPCAPEMEEAEHRCSRSGGCRRRNVGTEDPGTRAWHPGTQGDRTRGQSGRRSWGGWQTLGGGCAWWGAPRGLAASTSGQKVSFPAAGPWHAAWSSSSTLTRELLRGRGNCEKQQADEGRPLRRRKAPKPTLPVRAAETGKEELFCEETARPHCARKASPCLKQRCKQTETGDPPPPRTQ